MALSVASAVSLLIQGTPLDRIVAGAFATIVAWTIGVLRGLWAKRVWDAWLEYGQVVVLCLGVILWLW